MPAQVSTDQEVGPAPAINRELIASIRADRSAYRASCWETALVNTDAVGFDQLAGTDLVLDRVYRGGTAGGTRDDPLSKLLPVGNQGGFRPAGSVVNDSVKLVVLYTTGSEPDWPDALNPYTGTFTYYGDNRRPGRELEDTPNKGN